MSGAATSSVLPLVLPKQCVQSRLADDRVL